MQLRNVILSVSAAMLLTACGPNVQVGNVGFLVKTVGEGAGVQPQPLAVGYHFTGPNEYIIEYPAITRTYQWTKPGDGDNKNANEEFAFNDSTGLPLTADVSVTMHVDPSKVAEIYTKYKLDFDALRDGPVRAYVRTSIALEASKLTSDQLYTAARQQVITNALKDVQQHFAGSGIEISDLQWIGSIRFPAAVTQAIENKTKADQEAQVAERQVQVEKNRADAAVAKARGEADATRIKGEALHANPQVLQQEWISKWNGVLPTTVTGSNTMMMVKPD